MATRIAQSGQCCGRGLGEHRGDPRLSPVKWTKPPGEGETVKDRSDGPADPLWLGHMQQVWCAVGACQHLGLTPPQPLSQSPLPGMTLTSEPISTLAGFS